MKVALFLSVLVGFATHALAATIYVPDDHPTIQAAVDAAAGGDTIIVRPGVYFENVTIDGKPLTVQSELGPDVTVIDGSGAAPVLSVLDNWSDPFVIEGFTIRNGDGAGYDRGWGAAGVDFEGCFLTLTGNIIEDNVSDSWGTAVFVFCAPAEISANVIRNNRGGGIAFEDGCGTVIDNTIVGNSGDAIYVNSYKSTGERTRPGKGGTIAGNLIAENGSGVYGGNDSSASVSNNVVVDNHGPGIWFDYSFLDAIGNVVARNDGPGIACTDMTHGYIVDNLILNNTADYGAGIYCKENLGWGLFAANNIIAGNSAAHEGGGIWFSHGMKGDAGLDTPTLVNNTIANNTAQIAGGGVYCGAGANALVSNTILWNNSAPEGKEIWLGHDWWPSTLDIDHCDVEGGQGSVYADTGCTLNWGAGMIDADPLFFDLAGGDFHLTFNSPCGNAGNGGASGMPTVDFEGDPRGAWGGADMGADEFFYHLYPVGEAVPGGTISIRVTGWPNGCTKLFLGSGIEDPPLPTMYGDLHLSRPLTMIYLGYIPQNGVITLETTVPPGWIPSGIYPFQALVGGFEWPSTALTNLMVLTVD